MGKNRTIKILGNIIGNLVVHKVVIRNTHKPESIPHMTYEIGAYGLNASEIADEYNWNCEDKMKISLEALKKFKRNMQKYYPDVEFYEEEIPILIEETIDEYV
jgi:acetyl-CoA acetyltransferase